MGLPPTIPPTDDMTTHPLVDLPLSLRQNLVIQKCSHQIITSLASIQLDDSLYNRIEFLEKEASIPPDDIGKEDLTFTNSLRLAYVRLFLQCIYFLPTEATSPNPDKPQPQYQQRKGGILKAYTTAISLITIAISHKDALDELPHAPQEIPRMITAAAIVFFRILHSTLASQVSPSLPEGDSGRTACGMACFAIQRCSTQRGDEKDLPARLVGWLKMSWRAAETDKQLLSQKPVVKVTSRMGASVVFDSLDLWRQKYKSKTGDRQGQQGLSSEKNVVGSMPMAMQDKRQYWSCGEFW
ncbi:hypothetical protein BJX70DRAFT_374390 [Aspergillus crustosus]